MNRKKSLSTTFDEVWNVGERIMFNVAFTLKNDADTIVQTLERMLKEKGFHIDSIGKDTLETIHLKAVNKTRLAILKYQLKRGRDLDPEAQRVAVHMAVVPTGEVEVEEVEFEDDSETLLFISVYPIMEFYHLPEIPGITESEVERETDVKLSEAILNEMADAVKELFPGVKENYRTLPMRKTYSLPDSRHSISRDEVKERIVDILRKLKFEVIKTNETNYNLSLEIKAVNKSFFHATLERIKNRPISKFLKSAQRITVKFTILKPKLGYNHKQEIHMEMYPSMEFIGKEEIPFLSQSIDEEMTDSLLSKDLWEPLVSMMDLEFGSYAQ